MSWLRGPAVLTLVMFSAQVLGMASFVTFPALLPLFQSEWQLNNTEAGWISGVFFAGFVASTPILTTLTDRIDPKRIFLVGMVITAISSLGFGWMADGIWSATLWRILHGIGYGACYMPGMKALSDAVPESVQGRAVAFFTATYTIGVSFSFFVSGPAAEAFGWQTTYYLFALGPLAGILMVAVALPAAPKREVSRTVFEFKPIVESRPTLAYMSAYFFHNAESSTIRAFAVSFLVLAAAMQPAGAAGADWDPIMIAAIANLFGLPAIMLINEMARLWDRRLVISAIMVVCSLVGVAMAASISWGFLWVVGLMMLYGFLVPADVGSINAGLVGITDSERRGATMAIHAVCGFTGANLGPVFFGAILDLTGGQGAPDAWIAAFAGMFLMMLLGPVLLYWLGRDSRKA
ncbi:MAG TPA: MFS transporter [Rhodospirillaceae bacterium]|nr:MFS transporter [Rhodospirillaceae bacterium]HAT35385.1 MFS transporter [Rhodospirillaceae bacterium]